MTAQDGRRLAIAFAIAIALHEVAAVLIPRQPPTDTAEAPIVAHVTIARIVHTPTPEPSPTPTPPPVKILVPAVVAAGLHARVEPIKRAGAKRPTPPKVHHATPDVSIPTGGQGAGAQNGAGAGSLSNVNGNGNGTGNAGNGNGAFPCGAVDFEARGNAVFNPDTSSYERSNIIAYVHYSDGSIERIPLDWTWRYKSEDDDPFNPASSAPMTFQFPPDDQRAGEPPQVQYIIRYSSKTGHTNLNDQCPNIAPLGATPSPKPQDGKRFHEFAGFDGPAEVEALRAFAGQLREETPLLLRFDAFRDDLQSERARERHDRAHDRVIPRVLGAQVANEHPVDFHRVDRQSL